MRVASPMSNHSAPGYIEQLTFLAATEGHSENGQCNLATVTLSAAQAWELLGHLDSFGDLARSVDGLTAFEVRNDWVRILSQNPATLADLSSDERVRTVARDIVVEGDFGPFPVATESVEIPSPPSWLGLQPFLRVCRYGVSWGAMRGAWLTVTASLSRSHLLEALVWLSSDGKRPSVFEALVLEDPDTAVRFLDPDHRLPGCSLSPPPISFTETALSALLGSWDHSIRRAALMALDRSKKLEGQRTH